MRPTERGRTDLRTGLAMVHDPVQGRRGGAPEMRTIRPVVRARAQRDPMRGGGIRREHDGIM